MINMEEELQVGNLVIVLNNYGTPNYRGYIIGITKNAVLVKKLGLFGGEHLERRERVERMI